MQDKSKNRPAALSSRPQAVPPTVPAVDRAVRLLDLIAAQDEGLSLAALARQAGLPKSSVHGLLNTLSSAGLVVRDADLTFSLGPRILQWAGRYVSRSTVIQAFRALAPAFAALANETIMLAVLDQHDVIYLDCRSGASPLAVNFQVGGRLPASCTSTGKAMLASMDEADWRRAAGDEPLRVLTPRSARRHAALAQDLDGVRERGYAIDDEETAAGMVCFGSPVFAASQATAVAAVAVSLIKATVDDARARAVSAAICALADALSDRLGGVRAR